MIHYFNYLEKRLKESWNRTVMSDYEGSSFTGGEIAGYISAFHDYFKKTGFAKGDKAAIYGSSSARWTIAFLAVNTYEGVAVPILSDFRSENATNLAAHAEASVLFVDSSSWEKMDPEKIATLRVAISLDDYSVLWTSEKGADMDRIETLISDEVKGDISFPKDNLHRLAIINYTSGTTSTPKGVMLTYGNLATNVQYALDHIPPRPGDSIVSMLPLGHMYGFMFEFLYPLCGGVKIWFLGKAPTPSTLLGALKQVKPYILITVPLVMEKIIRNSVLPAIRKTGILMSIPVISSVVLRKARKKLLQAFGGNIRIIVMGGAPLAPEIEKWVRRIGLPYTVGYGMTEAAPLLAYESWQKYAAGSCGKVADRCRVRIDSDDPENIPGEIQARGENIMQGYYRNPEATSAAFTEDGWLRTGDSGTMDRHGNIFIRGRIKNLILSSNGQNIYPEEIESVANSMDGIQESVAVSRDGKITLLVYTGGEPLPEDFLQRVNPMLPAYSRISVVETVPEPFEKTPKMSIKRYLYK